MQTLSEWILSKSSKSSSNQPKADADAPALPPDPSVVAPSEVTSTTILDRWGISAWELTELVNENPSLRGIMHGYVAEHKFRQLIEMHPSISSSRKYDDHDRSRKSDRVVTYKGMDFSIEVKSLQTNSIRKIGEQWVGAAQVDGSDRRNVTFPDGTQLNTTLLLCGQFDILAVNCFGFENKWRFAFALNRDLPKSRHRAYSEVQRSQLIASMVPLTWPLSPPFVDDPLPLVELLYLERSRG